MATWIIGDVHGHLDPLNRLLEAIRFDARRDRLVFAGDLVNGGGNSLGVLRRLVDIDPVVCLGNHDLHLLAVHAGARAMREKDDFGDVLEAPDADDLLGWLCGRDIVFRDEELDVLVVHAGLLPAWTPDDAVALAGEVEAALRGGGRARLFATMYGDKPARWKPHLEGDDRLRVLVNAFTRMRLVDEEGRMEFSYSGVYEKIPKRWRAWFDCEGRRSADTCVVFGHWSALGLRRWSHVICTDSGARWGGQLTAYKADDGAIVQVEA